MLVVVDTLLWPSRWLMLTLSTPWKNSMLVMVWRKAWGFRWGRPWRFWNRTSQFPSWLGFIRPPRSPGNT